MQNLNIAENFCFYAITCRLILKLPVVLKHICSFVNLSSLHRDWKLENLPTCTFGLALKTVPTQLETQSLRKPFSLTFHCL